MWPSFSEPFPGWKCSCVFFLFDPELFGLFEMPTLAAFPPTFTRNSFLRKHSHFDPQSNRCIEMALQRTNDKSRSIDGEQQQLCKLSDSIDQLSVARVLKAKRTLAH